MQIFINGKFFPEKQAKIPVSDHAFLYGDGVFETMRAFGGRLWLPKEHVSRLFKSCELMLMPLPWKKEQVQKWIEESVKRNKLNECKIRVTVTRGDNGRSFIGVKKPTIVIDVHPWTGWPPEWHAKGIPVITFDGVRTLPEVKTTSLLVSNVAMQAAVKTGAGEAILFDAQGRMTEGTTCTAYAIKGKKIILPKTRILGGTNIAIVKKLAKKFGFKFERRHITERQYRNMDEAFITSVTRGIMPVGKVDGNNLKKKAPGPVTKQLMKGFDEINNAFKHGR